MADEQRERPTLDEQVAMALDAGRSGAELVPWLAELLADFDDLGLDSELVVSILRALELPAEARVLDLGCGKGVKSIALARELDMRAVGVDGLEAFIDSARALAHEHGLAERCEFHCGDLRDEVERAEGYDVVLLLSVGPVFGDQADTIAMLRRCVRPGGYILLDDAYLAPDVMAPPKGYELYAHHDETVSRLTAHGDVILSETVEDQAAQYDENLRDLQRMRARAEPLVATHPELSRAVAAFLEKQAHETRQLAGPIVGATWLIQQCG